MQLTEANESLRADKQRLDEVLRMRDLVSRDIVDNIPIHISLLSPTGEVEMINRQILNYTGQSVAELERWGMTDLVHHEDLARAADAHRIGIGSGEPFDIVYRMRRHDGVYRWFEARHRPMKDPDGRVLRWCVSVEDIDDRKRAEDALRESERQLWLIINNIPGLIMVATPDGEIHTANDQLLEYVGQTLEQVRRWWANGTVHPEDVSRVVESYRHSIATGSPIKLELRARRFDGKYRWLEWQGLPLRDAEARIVRWYSLLVDIDDRKRGEDAIRESELYARQIVDSIPGMIAVFSNTGEVEYVNQQVLDFFGDTLEDRKRWSSNGKVHPEDLARTIDLFARSVATGEPFDIEVRSLRHDGVFRWINSRALPLRDKDGRVVRWYNLLFDIDDRKRAEEALRESERRLKVTIDTIPALAWSARTDGSVEFLNRHYLDFVGLSVERLKGDEWSSAVHPDDRPGLLNAWRSMLTSGRGGEAAARMRRFDGQYRWLLFRMSPLRRGEAGTIVKWYGVNTDIQDRKTAEDALTTARSELAHVSRVSALNVLTASIAHEINQPLSGIITNANTCRRLLDAVPPNIEDARKTVQRTIRDGNRAAEIVARLRNFFSKNTRTTDAIDLNDAVREVVALISSDLQKNRVVLRTELAHDLPRLTADKVQLQQVMLNLLMNACDAMSGVYDRQRLAVLTTKRDGDGVQLSVRDLGVGFTAENAERLFEAFHTTKTGGMGIGLSVSRSIIESHNGRLWCAPNEGPGAIFSFSIPAFSTKAS